MNNVDTETFATDVQELPRDMKRVLRVQFREFIHFVEDAQDEICLQAADFNRNSTNREAA